MPVLKKDVRTAEFLLPHILVSVLCGAGEEGANTILTEIMTILTGADKTKVLVSIITFFSFATCVFSVAYLMHYQFEKFFALEVRIAKIKCIMYIQENGDVCFVEGNTGTLVAHALFSTLDHLKSWLRAKVIFVHLAQYSFYTLS